MSQTKQFVPDLDIKPRKMSFAFSRMTKKYWYNDNSVITSFFTALSATFPPGEAGFIESVRNYRDQITDPKLKKQISGFIGQEGHHSHQHKQVNQVLEDMGLHAVRLEKEFTVWLENFEKKLSHKQHLASTVCMEHITAILAEYMLTHSDAMDKMTPEIKSLLAWHAVEEIEHKAVAFDVYMQCEGDRELLRRMMVANTGVFILNTLVHQGQLLYWDKKMPSLKEFGESMKFMWGKEGLLRNLRKPYMEFFKKDFHPWQHNNMELIEQWKREYPEDAAMAG